MKLTIEINEKDPLLIEATLAYYRELYEGGDEETRREYELLLHGSSPLCARHFSEFLGTAGSWPFDGERIVAGGGAVTAHGAYIGKFSKE